MRVARSSAKVCPLHLYLNNTNVVVVVFAVEDVSILPFSSPGIELPAVRGMA